MDIFVRRLLASCYASPSPGPQCHWQTQHRAIFVVKHHRRCAEQNHASTLLSGMAQYRRFFLLLFLENAQYRGYADSFMVDVDCQRANVKASAQHMELWFWIGKLNFENICFYRGRKFDNLCRLKYLESTPSLVKWVPLAPWIT